MQRFHKNNVNVPEFSDEQFDKVWQRRMHTDQERFDLLAKYFEGGRYLDIGCFNSPKPSQLVEQYPDSEIVALDHGPRLIQSLSERFPKVKYIQGNCLALPFEDGYFDYVVAGEIIEHMDSPKDLIKEGMRVLKPGGYFALSTPKEETISQKNIGGEQHQWIFFEKDIRDLLEPYGELELQEQNDGAIIFIAWCKKN